MGFVGMVLSGLLLVMGQIQLRILMMESTGMDLELLFLQRMVTPPHGMERNLLRLEMVEQIHLPILLME